MNERIVPMACSTNLRLPPATALTLVDAMKKCERIFELAGSTTSEALRSLIAQRTGHREVTPPLEKQIVHEIGRAHV